VQPGDNLFRIATDHGLTVDDLQAANPDLAGSSPVIYPGDQITLPNCGSESATTSPDTPEPTTVSAPPGGQVYEVQPGDTLVKIAQEFGVTVEAIVAANNLEDPDSLDVGQQLVIPPPGT
jgi:LysM repeat protein